MRRRSIVAIVALGLTGPTFWLPVSLRQVEFFRVRQVELVGVKYLSPDTVLRALALGPDQNIFDNRHLIAKRAESVAGVVSARVERKLPGTLRLRVVERIPVAFAPGPKRMVALDGDGRPLPYDPAATGLDLPLIARADTLLARALSVVRLTDSTLFQDVDAARRGARGEITFEIGHRRLLLRGVPSPEEIRAIGSVRRHLASTGRGYDELDARFDGWVVVRRGVS